MDVNWLSFCGGALAAISAAQEIPWVLRAMAMWTMAVIASKAF